MKTIETRVADLHSILSRLDAILEAHAQSTSGYLEEELDELTALEREAEACADEWISRVNQDASGLQTIIVDLAGLRNSELALSVAARMGAGLNESAESEAARILESGSDPAQRRMAAQSLASRATSGSTGALARAAEFDPDSGVRRLGVEYLIRLDRGGEEGFTAPIRDILERRAHLDPDAGVIDLASSYLSGRNQEY